jgi:hypothetical protein
MNNHFLFNKPKTLVFHKCLTQFFDKVLGMHIGNVININHNLTKMIMNPIENIMLIEKWNCEVKVFLHY